jgi:hypothetical protein
VLSTALGEEKQTIFSTAAYVCLPCAVSPSPFMIPHNERGELPTDKANEMALI